MTTFALAPDPSSGHAAWAVLGPPDEAHIPMADDPAGRADLVSIFVAGRATAP